MSTVSHRPVLVVDFGAQYAQLIARRVREARVYSEIVPSTMPVAEMLAKDPVAVILSGGPSSVYADGAPQVDAALFGTGVPTFGICYGFQAMALALGGEVARTGLSEFGRTPLTVTEPGSAIFSGLPTESSVWMSHGDAVHRAPDGFVVTAVTDGAPVAAFEDTARGLAGVQFHPEVLHSENGQQVLEHFLYTVAGIEPTWTSANVIDEQVEAIRAQVGDKLVICGLSGGVDSAVAAALVHKAVGDNLTCVFVDHGLLRLNEAEQVMHTFAQNLGVHVIHVETAREMLAAVEGALPADIGIFAAAVADWRVATAADQKIKKTAKGQAPRLELIENPDILKTVGHAPAPRRPALVIGFAAETNDVIAYAQKKRVAKAADWIVANDVSPETGIMGGDRNTVHVVMESRVESWPEMDKQDVARRLVASAADALAQRV